jgi:LPXTG-motif cell wall-anchored protein
VDASNKFRTRPQDLALSLYFRDGADDAVWKHYDSDYFDIIWTKNNNEWSYTIASLPKYSPRVPYPRIYGVREAVPEYYTVMYANAYDNCATGTVTDMDTGDIVGVDITNTMTTSALTVTKQRDRTPELPNGDFVPFIFGFEVFVSQDPIDDDNPGMRYTGVYTVALSGGGTATSTTGANGIIEITVPKDEAFTVSGLPLGYYYSVWELEHPDYKLVPENSSGLGLSGTATLTSATPAIAYNQLNIPQLGIGNNTPNHSIENPGKTNAGGKVTINDGAAPNPDRPDEHPLKESMRSVAWAPESDRHWVLGNRFTISYTLFGDDTLYHLDINYSIDSGGNPVLGDISGTGDKNHFPRFELHSVGDTVVLNLANNTPEELNRMPREVWVEVLFEPTLAVNNATSRNAGGQVMVSGGVAGDSSDGVPALGGEPYPGQYSVFGIPNEGFVVDVENIFVYNLNDMDEVTGIGNNRVQIKPDIIEPEPTSFSSLSFRQAAFGAGIQPMSAGGDFISYINTEIAGMPATVPVSGVVIFDGDEVEIRFDRLPVPLQVDISFISSTPPPPNNNNGGGSGTGRGIVVFNPTRNPNTTLSVADSDTSTIDFTTYAPAPPPATGDNTPVLPVLISGILLAVAAFILGRKKKGDNK